MKKEKKKLTLKQKEERKQAIKKWLLMTLHLISYIFAVGFIIVLIIGLVGSCDKKPSTQSKHENHLRLDNKKNAIQDYSASVDYTDGYFYSMYDQYNETDVSKNYAYQVGLLIADVLGLDTTIPDSTLYHNFPLDYQRVTGAINVDCWRVSFSHGYSSMPSPRWSLEVATDYLANNTYYTYNRMWITYNQHYFSSPSYIDSIDIIYPNEMTNYQFPTDPYINSNMKGWFASNTTEAVWIYKGLLSLNNFHYNPYYNDGGSYSTSQFVFNEKFNYNAPKLSGSIYNLTKDHETSLVANDGSPLVRINLPLFKCNETYYNQIRLEYVNAEDYYYVRGFKNGSDLNILYDWDIVDNNNFYFYDKMYFVNTQDNRETLVNYRDIRYGTYQIYSEGFQYDHDGYAIYDYTYWTNVAYRTLVFPYELSSNQATSLTQFNTAGGGIIQGDVSGGTNSLFYLLTDAFQSVSSILKIELWTGLTIGGLMFVPLIITVIVAVVKLIKK